ncbi:dethiobiotin synthase [Dasania sp. GY-MA-18]|uniref:ATP-dependent dethiobiotin synthetase BioD n=1 Tax=Dasania phycosphaerae TaxID=2950436 RepID=A0A9J6RKS7_9GAMM|nr:MULTISPECIES: dethiobiotin synthase [Dasania]MCR8922396.1 dethiobiotin synthase [Dasania sp. GY-MA-18]MCZ0864824.1 dethiobiotin synthase [Dasania phycosphaerae]MCZ0868552.1 dethiobiotin synthase [Dasania phycosphaerae]
MGKKYFIAGTDTDAGKTLVATGLLEAANQQGLKTLAIKPVAAGCEHSEGGLRNSDALLLQQAMSGDLPYEQVNPIALEPAIAPHIAAEQLGKQLRVAQLAGYCRGVMTQASDFLLIEGAGGWRVPLNRMETLAGLAKELNTPVILVVGMKLGCISHALLTVEAIQRDGLPLAGWVANRIDPEMSCYEENFATLKDLIPAPCLGAVPHLDNANGKVASQYLDISLLA